MKQKVVENPEDANLVTLICSAEFDAKDAKRPAPMSPVSKEAGHFDFNFEPSSKKAHVGDYNPAAQAMASAIADVGARSAAAIADLGTSTAAATDDVVACPTPTHVHCELKSEHRHRSDSDPTPGWNCANCGAQFANNIIIRS